MKQRKLSNPHGSDVTITSFSNLESMKELSNPHGSDVTKLKFL